MLNPGYSVIAKKKKIEYAPGIGFICPNCKKICLEVDVDPGKFRTKCSNCGAWIYGEKYLSQKA